MFGKNILKNMDGEKYYDKKKNVFLMNFDEEQCETILSAISQEIDADVFAYPYIPVEDMKILMYYMKKNPYIKRIEFWKIGQSNMNTYRKDFTCQLLELGIRLLDQVSDVSKIVNDYVFEVAFLAKQNFGQNICKDIACDGYNDFKCGDINDLNRKYGMNFEIEEVPIKNTGRENYRTEEYTEDFELDFPKPSTEELEEYEQYKKEKELERQRQMEREDEDMMEKFTFDELKNL